MTSSKLQIASKPAPGKLSHIAIIMDGNRRWAKKKGLSSVKGHAYAVEHAIEPLIKTCVKLKIPYLTLWAFSTENWKRDQKELTGLFKIFRSGLNTLGIKLIKQGARVRLLGDINRFPTDIAQKSLDLINKSKNNLAITISFALNYGGRIEILKAVKKLLKDKIKPSQLTEQLFSSYLDTQNIPDPDLIIRTGGENRLSGFLPWQAVYSELYFTKTLFPDFTPTELKKALKSYSQRDRRFGGDSKINIKH